MEKSPSIPLFFLLCNLYLSMASLNKEGTALLSFKQSITEDPEASLSNWNSSDETPCSWNGITCKDLRVISLSIPKKKLKGFLPSSLGFLTELRHVNLRSNKLHGTLPLEVFEAYGLQSLVLYGNSFSGSVPNQIGKLKILQILDLSMNLFNGSLPVSIMECRRLRYFDVSMNNFTDSLPVGFGSSFSFLEKLDVSYNGFNGSIPMDFGNLSSLQGTVDLSHNLFSGSIPSSLGNLPEKVYIDLTYNNLSGSIPQNGALMNRGPTAFLGNPGLCGPPLKNPCSSETSNASSPSSFPFFPDNYPPGGSEGNGSKYGNGGMSRSMMVAIIIGDIVGICLIGLLFSYCYSRFCTCRNGKEADQSGYGFEKGKRRRRKDCFCFQKGESENVDIEQFDLIPLDSRVTFDLDELLKASAFVLGKSSIGIVYKVVLEDGVTLAVRRLGEGGSQRFKEFQTEVEAIGKLRHPNVVSLRAYYWSVDEKLLVYDYIPNGNLAFAIHGKLGTTSFTPLPWSARIRIMEGIAKGLAYLHECSPKKYVHGNLKANNILLGHDMVPHISNFGLARLVNIAGGSPTVQSSHMAEEKPQEKQPKSATSEEASAFISGLSSYYQAPESFKVLKPSQKWDVYSFGVILLEMITGRLPIVQVGASEMDLVQWIHLCIEEKKPLSDVIDPSLTPDDDADEEIIAVLKITLACVQNSPEKRPAMRHISDALSRMVVTPN